MILPTSIPSSLNESVASETSFWWVKSISSWQTTYIKLTFCLSDFFKVLEISAYRPYVWNNFFPQEISLMFFTQKFIVDFCFDWVPG